MDSARNRSDRSVVKGYGIPEESRKTPDGFRVNRNPGRVGKGREQLKSPRDAGRFDLNAYHRKHFPDENYWPLQAAVFWVRKTHDGGYPPPAEVLARMEEKGWTLAQREASTGEAA